MKIQDNARTPKGTLTLRAVDAQGVEQWATTEQNLIVNTGYQATAHALGGDAGGAITKVQMGDNATPPTMFDTAITNAVNLTITSVEYPNPTTVRFNFAIPFNIGVGMFITEFGLITGNGSLFSRKVREPIEKTGYLSIYGIWDIHM